MKILVLGNGFDIDHNLPTSYMDFLNFCNAVLDMDDPESPHLLKLKATQKGYMEKLKAVEKERTFFISLIEKNHLLHYFNSRIAILVNELVWPLSHVNRKGSPCECPQFAQITFAVPFLVIEKLLLPQESQLAIALSLHSSHTQAIRQWKYLLSSSSDIGIETLQSNMIACGFFSLRFSF